jgi:hypothetical protein
MALLASELMRMEVGELVIRAQPLARTVIQQEANALRLTEATSYRVILTRREGEGKVMRLWVAVRIENMGAQSWTPRELTLSAKGEALKGAHVGEPRPIPPREQGTVLVEVVATEAQSRSTFTLTLRDESGDQFITLGRVTFP